MDRQGRTGERPARLVRVLPDPLTAFAGALVWAGAMAGSAAVWLALSDRLGSARVTAILATFALGGALAFPPALALTRLIARNRGGEQRFATAFAVFGLASVLGVAFVFFMHYRLYYARWHEPFPSVVWAFQFVFTGAAAVYQFAVLGLRMFFPVGLVALLLVSLWQARQAR